MSVTRGIVMSAACGCALGGAAVELCARQREAVRAAPPPPFRGRRSGRTIARQLVALAEMSPCLVAVLDTELRYLGASRSWVERYFPGADCWIGRHHEALVPDLPERFRQAYRRALTGATVCGHEDSFVRADGVTHWVSWNAAPWLTENGEIGGITMTIHDVSELREKSREYEERVRTADRMASIGMLGAGLGHDVQNLLLPLRAHLNAIAAGERLTVKPRHAAHIEALRRGLEHLQHLSDSLHLLASEEVVADEDSGFKTSVVGWWSQFEALFRCAMPRRTKLEVRIDCDLPALSVSGHLLTRAMLNLFTNAARAIDARIDRLKWGGCVSVEMTATEDAMGKWVRISVSDNGIGMTPEVRCRATEAFFTTRNGGKGSGLGLAFVSRVVQDHGGRLEIESEEGVGTTMTMVMPAVEQRVPF